MDNLWAVGTRLNSDKLLSTQQVAAATSMIDEIVRHLTSISAPRAPDFDARLHLLLGRLDRLASEVPTEEAVLRRRFLDATEDILGRSDLIARGRNKPLGYAGDYQIIDWTYLKHVGSDPIGALLDEFYHEQVAPQAVRDRKDRFGRVLSDIAAREDLGRPVRILNVGSGPGREIIDGARASGLSPSDIAVTCVEMDSLAIEYARSVFGSTWGKSITFWRGNAMRYRPIGEFDLVWSAGLFDYLNDRLAAPLLKRLWGAVAPGGRLVIGNFADTHQTRHWIEWCGDWFLIHRSLAELAVLGASAGISAANAQVYADKWGAVGFLDAERPPAL